MSQEEKELNVPPYEVVEAFKVPVPNENIFLMLQLTDEQGKYLTDDIYCLAATDDVYDWAKSLGISLR